MAIYTFEGRRPTIGKETFIADSAEVIGNVNIGEYCFIGPGVRLRGDVGDITIGPGTAIEDNCSIHVRPQRSCEIGERVTIGHHAIIHNATIEDYAVIGMGAIISDYAQIGRWSVIGEGCVVSPQQIIAEDSIAVGSPAEVVGLVNQEHKELWLQGKQLHIDLAIRYRRGLKKV